MDDNVPIDDLVMVINATIRGGIIIQILQSWLRFLGKRRLLDEDNALDMVNSLLESQKLM